MSKTDGKTTAPGSALDSLGSIEALAGVEDVETRTVYVPQWKASVTIRAPQPAEADYYEQIASLVDEQGKRRVVDNVRTELVARCLCAPEPPHAYLAPDRAAIGKLVAVLNTKNSAAIRRLFGECKVLAGIVITEAEVERVAGNSSGDPDGASASGSPGSGAAPSASSTSAA